MEESNGGRPRQDYIINIDMAKELSMLQRSVQGKKARKYFIECEKALSNRNQLSDIDILKLLYREKRVYITT